MGRRRPAVFVVAFLALSALGPAAGAAVVGLPGLPLPGSSARTAGTGGGTALTGTFRVVAGSCSNGVTGSWFQMLSPAGSPVNNSDSPCSNQAYTPLSPGSDGGLVSGSYQPDPSPAFDGTGNGLAHRIFRPTKFYGVEFAVATDSTDPQTGKAVPAPSITADGGTLGGDLRAVTVSWNNQHFNQGAPKPDGTSPGKTSGPTGTYNPSTGAFKVSWSSQIVGGPFNNFTGTWQIEGTFVSASPAAAPAGAGPSSGPTATAAPASSGPSPASGVTTAAGTAGSDPTTGATLPVTGGGLPLLPTAGLLGAGLLARRAGRLLSGRRS